MGTSQSTAAHQTPYDPCQRFVHDLFYYPPLSTPIDQRPNRPVQGYLQVPINYSHLSTPIDQTPNKPGQGFVEELFYYPPLSTPTYQTPNGPVQSYMQDLFNPPLVRKPVRNRACFSCTRLEFKQPIEVEYTNLGDGRHLCPDCLSICLVDPGQLEPLIGEVHGFFEDYLELPVKKDIPIFFVDANEMDKYFDTTAFGMTILEGDTIKIVKRCLRRGANIHVVTETKKLKHDKVKAITLLFGFPRQILGATLAHEMVHALIRLQGWSFRLESKVEEGICEAIAYEWLRYTTGDYDPSYTQKDAKIAEILTAYHKSLIEQGIFGSCGAEFWKARHAIKKYGLKRTLKRVARLRNIPE